MQKKTRSYFSIAMLAFVFGPLPAHAFSPVPQGPVNEKDPYSLTFDDFPHESFGSGSPIKGAKSVASKPDLEAAIDALQLHLSKFEQDYSRLTLLGQLLLRHGKEKDDLEAVIEAEAKLRAALAIREDHYPAELTLARTLETRHKFNEALELASSLSKDRPRDIGVLSVLFDCHLGLGQFAESRNVLDKLIDLESSAPLLARSARLRELSGEFDAARQQIDLAISDLRDKGDPAIEWYLWRKATLFFADGQFSRASDAFNQVLEIDPQHLESRVGLAESKFAEGRREEATEILKEAANSGAAPILALYGDLLLINQQNSEARKYWDRAEKLMKQENEVAAAAHAKELALFLADHKRDFARAQESIDLDFQQRPNPFSQNAQAWVLFKRGKSQEAVSKVRSSLASGMYDYRMLLRAALIEGAAGNSSLARKHLGKLGQNPEFYSITYYNDIRQLQKQLDLTSKRETF